MDYLFKKLDGSATSLGGGTVGKIQLPEMTGADVIFTGNQRPLDLGEYVLVKATEVTEEVTSGKKRGDTTTTIDADNQTVTVTYTAVDLTTNEKAQMALHEKWLNEKGSYSRDDIQPELDKLQD